MSAATAGYQAIEDNSVRTNTDKLGGLTSTGSSAGTNNTQEKIQEIIKVPFHAVQEIITAPSPSFNLYTEPLNPSAQLTINDRFQLILESCRSWSEFFDLKAFNLPSAHEIKLRVGHNIECFFYNYVIIGFGLLAITELFHPLRSLLITFVIAVTGCLYIVFPQDYIFNNGTVIINRSVKNLIVGCLVFFTIWFGHVISLFFFFATFFIPIVLLHSLLREHSAISSPI